MKTKKCYACKQVKPIAEFLSHKGRPGGLRTECRLCTSKMGKEWREKNKKYVKEFRRKYFIQSGHDQRNRRDIKGIIKRDYPEDGYCEVCHLNKKRLAYHHWDDNFPSWGIWLCAGCHVGANFLEKEDLTIKYWELRRWIEQTYNPDISKAPKNVGELKAMKHQL